MRNEVPARYALAGARVLCAGHAFLRNLPGGSYDFGRLVDAAAVSTRPSVVQAWDALNSALLAW